MGHMSLSELLNFFANITFDFDLNAQNFISLV